MTLPKRAAVVLGSSGEAVSANHSPARFVRTFPAAVQMKSPTIASAIACLTLLSAVGCSDITTSPLSGADRASIFGVVWGDLDRHYPYFAYARVDWDSVGHIHRQQAMAAA